ncbi:MULTISPECIES: hypothetical protein [unclassified Streptomyces]|uniref:hypothetical protein n=1 Tax=unclassified Streptomyces TaxID=2593676 RepID=UPI0033D9204A
MKVQLPLTQATALFDQSASSAGDFAALNLITYRLRTNAMREDRQRIESLLRTLELRLDPPPELAAAVAQARQLLEMEPIDRGRPSSSYVRILRSLTTRVEALRVSAATYTSAPQGADVKPIHARLGRTAEAHGGNVCWFHHDRGLSDWPLWERPGWQRLQRLIQGKWITLLTVESASDLVPPICVNEPQWGRRGLETWLYGWGIRLVCRTEADPEAGALR